MTCCKLSKHINIVLQVIDKIQRIYVITNYEYTIKDTVFSSDTIYKYLWCRLLNNKHHNIECIHKIVTNIFFKH